MTYISLKKTIDIAAQEEVSAFGQSDGLPEFLAKQGISIMFSSYQSGLLYTLRYPVEGEPRVHQPVTGKILNLNSIDKNDSIAISAIDLPHHSYRGPWRPPFIPALADEERCQITGLAMEGGQPAYVSAILRSGATDGRINQEYAGGVVIDARSGKIICEGLSKPHSPRLHNGELWVLNSGTGELGVVEGAATGKGIFQPRVVCPGFARELIIHHNYAFVGLPRPR